MVSDENWRTRRKELLTVLILVLMEYGLGHIRQNEKDHSQPVLILVLMEYGLVLDEHVRRDYGRGMQVLILVL